jgi:hypothetical protein
MWPFLIHSYNRRERERKEMGFVFMSGTKEAKRKCVCVWLQKRRELEFLL